MSQFTKVQQEILDAAQKVDKIEFVVTGKQFKPVFKTSSIKIEGCIIQAAIRASNLQLILSKKRLDKYFTADQFQKAFGMSNHLWHKLNRSGNVGDWLKGLDPENEKIFFTSEHFSFLD